MRIVKTYESDKTIEIIETDDSRMTIEQAEDLIRRLLNAVNSLKQQSGKP